jgi:hypothetical protein
MAIKITSIGNHAAAFRDGPGILSPVRFCQKGKSSSVLELAAGG